MDKTKINCEVEIDTTALDLAIEKAERLVILLEKADKLIDKTNSESKCR